jgi:predicted amidohydrolase YtcJ
MSVFKNGYIITLEGDNIAEAFIVRDDKFAFVGSNEDIMSLAAPDEDIVDLKGQTVVPGFNDSHMHFLNYAVFKSRVSLSDLNSINEMIETSKAFIEKNNIPKGEWIISRGWNHNHFSEERLPNRYDLDKISTEHPIFFSRVCGHIGAANTKALEVSGVTKDTENPDGGVIDKQNGELKGILRENAMNFIFEKIPSMKKEEIKKVLKSAFIDALKTGLTTIHSEDMGTAGDLNELIEAYKELEVSKELPLRFSLQLNLNNKQALENAAALNIKSCDGSRMFNIGALKLYQDGSLGGRTAAMKEPYADTDNNGVIIYSQEDLDTLVLEGHKAGFQLAIHAIGDRAMEMILNSYEKLEKNYSGKDLRPVIIHCQFTNKEILQRFKQLNVIANVQPSFVMTDWPIVEKAVGKERAFESYNWKSMLDHNIKVSFSSDAPIESFNPLYGIYAAVTRKNLAGEPSEGWYKGQSLSVMEALIAFTLGSAYMNFEENIKGSISPGKLADFVVLSENILTTPSDKIKDIKVMQTFVGGRRAY